MVLAVVRKKVVDLG